MCFSAEAAATADDAPCDDVQPAGDAGDTSTREQTTPSPPSTFADFEIHPASLHALEHKFRVTVPTEIQRLTFDAAASGRDVLGRARTGTGKTLAFLLPAVENALRSGRVPGPHGHEVPPAEDGRPPRRGGVAVLIIAPTRELAVQIHGQAQLLASSHANWDGGEESESESKYRMASCVITGGSPRELDLRKMADVNPFFLVATPGRLLDHMGGSELGGAPFAEVVGMHSVLVLDEADRCVDMGFKRDVEFVLDSRRGPEGEQQLLLFSATVPKALRPVLVSCMRDGHATADCLGGGDGASGQTNSNVDQAYVTFPPVSEHRRWIAGLADILDDIITVTNREDFKVLVFFPTTSMCEFMAQCMRLYKVPVLEIHSRKTQSNRSQTSNSFRHRKTGVLFTTDVSARGVDYPDVTHVVQFGSAEDKETYVHRLGRTGRSGGGDGGGRGLVIFGSGGEERAVLRELGGLGLRRDGRYQALLEGKADGGGDGDGRGKRRDEVHAERIGRIKADVARPDSRLHKLANHTYRSLLGYQLNRMAGLGLEGRSDSVRHLNALGEQMGFEPGGMPKVSPRMVANMGLRGVAGLSVFGGDDLYEAEGRARARGKKPASGPASDRTRRGEGGEDAGRLRSGRRPGGRSGSGNAQRSDRGRSKRPGDRSGPGFAQRWDSSVM